jgi:glutathione synthase/RimK-type ligase-like ATP-grasp enzyme
MSGRWPAHAAREAVLADLERAMTESPAALDVRFYRASFLRDHGCLLDALAGFEEILDRVPDHVETLVAYGITLVRCGRRLDARAAFARAVDADPEHYVAKVNLANQLALDDPDRAVALLEEAVRSAPEREAAHRSLCGLAAARGDAAAAARHRAAGYASGPFSPRAYLGSALPALAIALVSTDGGNLAVDVLLDPRRWYVHELAVETYRGEPLPPHSAILNAIADADRAAGALARAAEIARGARVRTINSPDAVARTGRVDGAARLGSLPGVRTPRTWRVADGAAPHAYPAIVRVPGLHMGRGMVRVDDEAAFRATLAERGDRRDLIAMDYLDTRSPDGAWRKYRVMIVDGALYPLHLAVGTQWMVHYFSAAMADQAAFRAEEARFLNDPVAAIGRTAWDALGRVRDRLGLDYAGVDFALDGDGGVIVFEANAAMAVIPPDRDERYAYRRPAADRIAQAIAAMLERCAARRA